MTAACRLELEAKLRAYASGWPRHRPSPPVHRRCGWDHWSAHDALGRKVCHTPCQLPQVGKCSKEGASVSSEDATINSAKSTAARQDSGGGDISGS